VSKMKNCAEFHRANRVQMKQSPENIREQEHPIFEKGRRTQPAGLFAFFAMLGIAVLFITILVMFVLSAGSADLARGKFPWLFYISTPLILICSAVIEKTKKAFRNDEPDQLLRWFMWTMAASVAFCILQFFAWKQLWGSGITLYKVNGVTSHAGAFLFVLSGLHVLHLAGGLCFLFMRMFALVNSRGDEVRTMIYFADKREGARISALALYWHFLAGLWVVMLGVFAWFFANT
jgi:cytochrome c oxidase subunit III